MKIEISNEDLEVISGFLDQGPYRVVAPVINRINSQIQQADKDARQALVELFHARRVMYESILAARTAGTISDEAWEKIRNDPDFTEWERQQAASKADERPAEATEAAKSDATPAPRSDRRRAKK